MGKAFKTLLFLTILCVGACQKQKAPAISDVEKAGREEQERLNACSVVNFNKDVLLYQNVISLFKCTKWDKDFPSLFASLNKISGDSWNHAFRPITENFIDDQKRRDRIFKNIRELDSKGGLDDLSYVIIALNETNFFDSVSLMFECVNDPSKENCESRMKNIPSKAGLKNLIKLVDFKPEVIKDLSFFVKRLNLAINPRKEEIRKEINNFRRVDEFINLRLKIIDAITSKIKNGLKDEDRTFLQTVLVTGNSSGELPWIYEWIRDEKMSRDKFKDLIEFPILSNPEFTDEIKALKSIYDSGINCTYAQGGTLNETLDIDYRTHLSNYVEVIRNKDLKRFYDYSSTNVVALKMASEVCSELEKNKFNTSFVRTIVHLNQFLQENKNFELLKFLLKNSTAKGDSNKTFSENLYLFDLIASDIFGELNAVNGVIIKNTRDFYPLVFDTVYDLNPSALINLARVVEEIALKENDAKFIGLAEFWNFFTVEEKNFLFRFVDRHFDEQVNYTLLFDFYTKFLDEYRDTHESFKEAWISSPEKLEYSYLSLENMFHNLSGKETLSDFKRFFSRDHIIKILEVLANGQELKNIAREELDYINSTKHVTNSKGEKYVFKVVYKDALEGNVNSGPIIDCLKDFMKPENNFYYMVRNFSNACKMVEHENIAFKAYSWLNSIEADYKSHKKPASSLDSIFDQKGLLSPWMLNTTIGLSKIIDTTIGELNSPMPTNNGIQYLLDSVKNHLNGKNLLGLTQDLIVNINQSMALYKEKAIIYRNSIIKSFSSQSNFSYTREVISNYSKLLADIGIWVQNGKWEHAKKRDLGKEDPKFTCQNSINQKIAPYPCPTVDIIKLYGNDILASLHNVWEEKEGSPVSLLVKAAKTGEGLEIPLDGKNTKKYRMNLDETIRYHHYTFDKARKVNKQVIKYRTEKQELNEVATVLERVETVIREVRFGNNYLGALYLNHVVAGDDYNKDVKERKLLFESCIKIPGVRCGRKMSDNDKRMAKNAVDAFDSLLDVNNGRGLDSNLVFGDFLKTFQQTLVGSSAYEAQKAGLFPPGDDALKRHNGKILSSLTMMNGFSNIARFIQDRMGRSLEELNDFLKRPDFKRVDRQLMAGFNTDIAGKSAEKLVYKLRTIPNGEKQNLFGTTVDWLSTLNYSELRLVEDTIARLLVVGSYLGTPDVVFEQAQYPTRFNRYKDNNLYLMFNALEKIVEHWAMIKKVYPSDTTLINFIKPINTFLYYLTEKLNSEANPEKNITYIALNDTFAIFQKILLEDVEDNRILNKTQMTFRGLDIALETLKTPQLLSKYAEQIRSFYNYSDYLFADKGIWFREVAQNLTRLTKDSRVGLDALGSYLNFTSKDYICISQGKCELNYHYDEVFELSKFLLVKDSNGKTNLERMNQKVFIENYSDINGMINDLMPSLKIKTVIPPLY